MTSRAPVQVDALIERQNVGAFLLQTLAIGIVVQILEGFDLIAIGNVGPSLIASLNVEPARLGPVFGAGFIGAAIGALLFGVLADWFGRKPVTILCTIIFGAFSLATVAAHTIPVLIALRFFTGLGIGGVMPITVALLNEYAPARVRGTVVTVMACGLSVGGAGAGLVAAKLVPAYGWTSMFYVGGCLPLVIAPLLVRWLPESARFLVLKRRGGAQIAALMARIDKRLQFDPATEFTVREATLAGFPVRHLFDKGWAKATLLLWATIFLNLTCVTFFSQWMPTLYNGYGLDLTAAVTAAAIFQVGGIVGAYVLGRFIDYYGFFSVLGVTFFGAAISTILLVSFGPNAPVVILLSFVAGLCLAGGQNATNALSGALYPTLVRATGSGWGLGLGRLGGIVGPLTGGFLVAQHWHVTWIFYAAAVPAVFAGVAVLLLGRQAERSPEMREARQLEASLRARGGVLGPHRGPPRAAGGANLKINLGCWNYDRTRGLMDGSVRPEGITLTYHNLFVAETFQRMLRFREFEAAEMGLTFYVGSLDQSPQPLIAIPIFPLRFFRHSAIFVHANSGIHSPKDLIGKRLGELFFYGHDAGIWAKGIMADDYGVPTDSGTYVVGGIDQYVPPWDWVPFPPPSRVAIRQLGENETLDQLLEKGDIDAVYSAIVPPSLLAGSKNVRRLFPDYQSVERDYFRRTGIFPIMHTLAIRRDVYERNPWVAKSLYDAFKASKALAESQYKLGEAFMHGMFMQPWFTAYRDDIGQLMGGDHWPYGVAPNYKTLDTFLRYHHEQGLSRRRYKPEELFAPETLVDDPDPPPST